MSSKTAKEEFLEVVDRVAVKLAEIETPWWLWNGFLVVLALSTLTAALMLEPRADQFVYLWGHKVGDTCAAITYTGYPCPQCGMTRSFVYGARFDVMRAFWYNPAGYTLFVWLQVGGVVGAIRLLRRDRRALGIPYWVPVYWTGFWVVVLYLVPYLLRLWGINPLPG